MQTQVPLGFLWAVPLAQPVLDLEKYMDSLSHKMRAIDVMNEGIKCKLGNNEQGKVLRECSWGKCIDIYIYCCLGVTYIQNNMHRFDHI